MTGPKLATSFKKTTTNISSNIFKEVYPVT